MPVYGPGLKRRPRGVPLVSTRHSPPAIPIAPLQVSANCKIYTSCACTEKDNVAENKPRRTRPLRAAYHASHAALGTPVCFLKGDLWESPHFQTLLRRRLQLVNSFTWMPHGCACRGAMGIAMPVGAQRPAFRPCSPARTHTPHSFWNDSLNRRDGLSGCFSKPLPAAAAPDVNIRGWVAVSSSSCDR